MKKYKVFKEDFLFIVESFDNVKHFVFYIKPLSGCLYSRNRIFVHFKNFKKFKEKTCKNATKR